MQTNVVYHMCPKSAWETSCVLGRDYYPPTYDKDGFIHATQDPEILITIANHFYKDAPIEEAWIILVIDSNKLTSRLVYEPAAPVGDKSSFQSDNVPSTAQEDNKDSDVLFPHIYGTIQKDSVVDILPMMRDSRGAFVG